MIALRGVGHVYGLGTPWARRALTDVDLRIAAGEAVAVAGPNGAGKTTLAWILAGLLFPTEGRATLDGDYLDVVTGDVLIAFQHARLQLFRPTVAEDVRFGADLDDAGVDAALQAVGLDPAAVRHLPIDDLSGGQQRRVALAALLARRPRLLVLDEPFAGLDAPGRDALVCVLHALRAAGDLAYVVVSHDLDEAARVADRLVVLDGGRVVGDGPFAEVVT